MGIKLAQEKHFPDETEEQKEVRKSKRHEKFGELAKELSKESEFEIPLEHIELLLEVIEDELDSKRPSDSIDEISKMVKLQTEVLNEKELGDHFRPFSFFIMFNPSVPDGPNWRISPFEKRLPETETL